MTSPDPVEPPQDESRPGITSIPELIGRGVPDGVCDLNASGLVPMRRLPLSIGGTGGLVPTDTQVSAHQLSGNGNPVGLNDKYSFWAKMSNVNYYNSPEGAYQDGWNSPMRYTVYADYYVYTTAAAGLTQWAEVEVDWASTDHGSESYAGLILRCQASSRNRGIIVAWGGGPYVAIGVFGTSRSITWLRQANHPSPGAPEMGGDSKLRAYVSGDTVTVMINGVEVLAYSGSQISGINNALNIYSGVFALNKCKVKNFAIGTISTPMKVNDPLAIHLQSQYVNPANTDMYAGGNWQRMVGPDVFRSGGVDGLGGYTPYARCIIPTAGWYRVELGVQSISSTGTAACKIMARTGTAAPEVTSHSIASALGNAGGEGTPLYCTSVEYFSSGTVIYWSTWTSVSSTIPVAAFGSIKSRFILTRIA